MAPGQDEDPNTAALFGAQVPGMPDKPPPAPPIDEENPMGGSMFKNMMARAKNPDAKPLSAMSQAPQQPQAPPTMPQAPPTMPQAPQQPQAMDSYGIYQAQLEAWQQQMTAFAQFSAANPEAASQMTMPPPPQPPVPGAIPPPVAPVAAQPPPVAPVAAQPPGAPVEITPAPADVDPDSLNPYDYLPQGDGRNNQSFEVNNSADVYFAQLKRDSRVRTQARKAGDLETANKPMEDVGVKALNNLLSEELIAARREQLSKNGGEFETSRDEMLLPSHFAEEEEVDKTATGVSYKERLEIARKKRKNQKSAQSSTPTSTSTSTSTESNQYAPKVKPLNLAPPTPEPAATEEFTMASTAPEPVATEAEAESKPNFALPVKDESDMETIAAPSMEDSEETRRTIRTLMGLLLKHRGGSGFGHGRLKGPEAVKLGDISSEVLSMLSEESGYVSTSPVKTVEVAQAAPQQALSGPLAGAIACVDAAVNMYKNADAAGQSDLILPVRDALLSAVNTINSVVAEEELQAHKAQAEAEAEPVYATTMEFPETYNVAEKEEEELQEIVDAVASGKTIDLSENTARLQKAYDTMKLLTGNEKFGLKDLDSDEVS
jgi:hypothetical protein